MNTRYLKKMGRDKMILLTAHRRENLGEPMRHMFKAIKRLLVEFDDIQVVYPVHLNPVVREIAAEILGNEPKVHLIEPLEVFDFHNFASRSYMILTDSGGVQEEAPSLGNRRRCLQIDGRWQDVDAPRAPRYRR